MPAYDKKTVTNLVLTLLYMTGWREGKREDGALRSWRSYDWDALDFLDEADLISYNRRNKSVYLTEEGERQAQHIVDILGYVKLPELDELAEKHARTSAEHEKQLAFSLRLSFSFRELTCWRDIIVPADYTFYDLHFVIQTLFNWLDYHLYDFLLTSNGEKLRLIEEGGDDCDNGWLFEDSIRTNIETVRLSHVFPQAETALYSYDYGDGWEIAVDLLEVVDDYSSNEPLCIAGEGDNPPEDVGGEGGFIEFLGAISDREHPEHQDLKDWGKGQGFRRFRLQDANRTLSKWRENQAIHNRNKKEAMR